MNFLFFYFLPKFVSYIVVLVIENFYPYKINFKLKFGRDVYIEVTNRISVPKNPNGGKGTFKCYVT